MINKIKTNIKISLVALSLAACLPSCVNKDEFFELTDRNGIDATIWSTDGAVQWHLSQTYNLIVPQFPFQSIGDARYGVHYANDESYFPDADQYARAVLGLDGVQLVANDVRLVGNKYQTTLNDRNYYWDIARCNDAIDAIAKGTLDQNKKNIYLGQYHALRAIAYFDLVKCYGGVPLILTPQTPENIYNEGRKSAKECMASIVSDLDKAISFLQGFAPYANYATEGGKINALIASCLKGRVLLYWASPQFNPLNDPKHPYDVKRWDDALAANKAAYDMATTTGGRSLMANYSDVFLKKLPVNTEAIFVRPYSNTVTNRGQDVERRTRPNSEGGNAASDKKFVPSIAMLNAYPMKDGNMTGSSAYTLDETMFWLNRDPRFEATIAYNGSVWPLSGVANRKQWNYNGADQEANSNGVYMKRFSDPSVPKASVAYSGVGGNGMDWIELRLAEVMLNLADCYNETGNITEAKKLVRLIRQRAKIEVGAGANDYGLGNANTLVAMRNLIIKERQIEFAFENKRTSDLRRTRTMHLLTGQMGTIEIPLFGTAATTKATLEAKDANGISFRDKIDINNKTEYLKYFQAPKIVTKPLYLPYNSQEYYYFYSFHTDFVNSALNIETTIGWSGGTFDPLDN